MWTPSSIDWYLLLSLFRCVRAPLKYLSDYCLSLACMRTGGILNCLCFFYATWFASINGISLFLSTLYYV